MATPRVTSTRPWAAKTRLPPIHLNPAGCWIRLRVGTRLIICKTLEGSVCVNPSSQHLLKYSEQPAWQQQPCHVRRSGNDLQMILYRGHYSAFHVLNLFIKLKRVNCFLISINIDSVSQAHCDAGAAGALVALVSPNAFIAHYKCVSPIHKLF